MFKLTEKAKKVIADGRLFHIQHVDAGDYDYTEYGSAKEVVDIIISEIRQSVDTGDSSYEKLRQEAENSFCSYTAEELLKDAATYSYPVKLGYVEEIEE